MAYTSPWEQLSEALARVREATGLSQTEAQADICRAIADGVINIRCALGRHSSSRMTSKGTVLDASYFQVPTSLKPEDLDWVESRPLQPWLVRRETYKTPGHWYLDWIQLLRTNVTNALCELEVGGPLAARARRIGATKRRSRPAHDRARRAITALYPASVPPQAEVPNSILCRKIADWLKANKLPDVSDDTILRAAGRRK